MTTTDFNNRIAEIRELRGESFGKWMARVDRTLEKVCGMTSECVGDAPYRDWWDSEWTPAGAAAVALVDWNDYPLDALNDSLMNAYFDHV